ncbi:MAG: Gfo/Idh/MocA family oxidoreductase [Candidatus Binatia bacterium]|nr:Gfo/Idh/MocA family oxidoreductase [Candidatus Binatia bacterium]
MNPLRIGLIGAGKHGSRYAKHIVEDLPQALLVSLCRRDQEAGQRLAATYGCAYYADYRHMLARERLDAVAVVVPPARHGEIVAAACRAGVHLLIEKPFAVSVREARRLRHLITASGVRCMVAHTLRFNSVVQALKAHIAAIGPLHSLYLSQRFEPSPLVWLDRITESGGGIILHTGVHSFDLLRYLSEREVDTVWCQSSRLFTTETEDHFVMMCRLRPPPLWGAVMGSRATQSRSGLIELAGEQGQLLGDHTHGYAYLIRGLERVPLPVAAPVPTVRETLRAFIEGLQQHTPFPISVEDGIRAIAIAEACARSATSGQPAAVEEVL